MMREDGYDPRNTEDLNFLNSSIIFIAYSVESLITNYFHFSKQDRTLRSDNLKVMKTNPHLTQSSRLVGDPKWID